VNHALPLSQQFSPVGPTPDSAIVADHDAQWRAQCRANVNGAFRPTFVSHTSWQTLLNYKPNVFWLLLIFLEANLFERLFTQPKVRELVS
jgi:hypothetical protein